MLTTLLATIVTLGVLVTIHEWGHFWVARRCGVKVLKFVVGFGTPLISWTDKQGTEFGLAAIPLGGYVKMLDEREGPVPAELLDQAFTQKSVWQRIAIVAAGPLVNLFFAVFIYWCVFLNGIVVMVPVIGDIAPDSIAAESGVEYGDVVTHVDGKPVDGWRAVNFSLVSRLGDTGNIVLTTERNGQEAQYSLAVQEWLANDAEQNPLRLLGIRPFVPETPPVLGDLVSEGAAEAAGLLHGDEILKVNGELINNWTQWVNLIQAHPGVAMDVEVLRADRVINISLVPKVAELDSGKVVGRIGAYAKQTEWPEEYLRRTNYGPVSALSKAFVHTGEQIMFMLSSIGKMITGTVSVNNISGPITIAKIAGETARIGVDSFLGFLALLSISLGVLNLLPVPVLDGGHLLFYFFEAVRGKPLSERVQLIGVKIGMLLLISLMVVALFNDFSRL